jgi:hypothetical protein
MKKILKAALAYLMAISCLSVCGFASAAAPLDEATKQAYYAEYLEIAQEVALETELDISVLPFDEFQDEDWRTPEEFRNFITEVANWNLAGTYTSEPAMTRSTASATKTTTVTADGHNYTLAITGNFETGLNTSTGRQHFSSINSITSKLAGYTGTWKQTGYEAQPLDAARTFAITVSGELTIAGTVFANKLAYVEFYCSSTGVVK